MKGGVGEVCEQDFASAGVKITGESHDGGMIYVQGCAQVNGCNAFSAVGFSYDIMISYFVIGRGSGKSKFEAVSTISVN